MIGRLIFSLSELHSQVYNKMCYDDLDKMLGAYNLPEGFQNIVKSLYKLAAMVVTVNGTPSIPFEISRGV